MPPAAKRQRTSAATAAAQGTLNFRSSKAAAAAGASHHIKANKPVSTLPSKSKATPVTTDDELSQTPSQAQSQTVDISEPSTQTLGAVEDELDEDVQAEIEAEKALAKKALALSDTKLKAYWSAKEKERKAPRVHQKELTIREKMLREWDMSTRYGPSIGITRLARWKRAYGLDMNPPIEILAVLLKETESARDRKDKEAELSTQKSVMDDLTMSSRLRGEIEA